MTVATHRLIPPHAPDEWSYVRDMIRALRRDDRLPPVVAFRGTEADFAVCGSHRIAAWNEFERETGERRHDVLYLSEQEMADGLARIGLALPIETAWPKVPRIGNLANCIFMSSERPEILAALDGQW